MPKHDYDAPATCHKARATARYKIVGAKYEQRKADARHLPIAVKNMLYYPRHAAPVAIDA